uniref:Putative DNA-binding transcriptional repressor, Zn(II)-binding, Zur n=1 Tax=Magnetococcus massalia (strain MO-1) TaxID=451514 RepID=A0A1S7LEF1_MAGMO|nr:putative DNA-binding transcriptional repressor, Zn(II)-binding, Zur [Candidatus Magnetococcus massalia]
MSHSTPICQSFPQQEHDHGACQAHLMEQAEQLCRQRGGRLTSQRQQVLTVLAESHACLGAYDILERLAKGAKRRPAPALVYRALEFLMAMGLVHRINRRNAYVACLQPGHEGATQFWICTSCGVVAETHAAAITETIPPLAESLSFVPERIFVEIEGLCPACQQTE